MGEQDPGFLLVDKDGGWTSHDVVARVRRLARRKKVGHAGTLDPMATGLVVLALGRATRLLRFVQDLRKEYLARVGFGIATDTLDADGAIMSREPMPVSEEEVESVLPRFVGRIMQVPPMVSALRVEGRRLYELARKGEVVERPARPVEIDRIEMVDFSPGEYPEATLRVACGRGTYIRSLADDIARALGGRAHLTALRRLRIGSLDVEHGHRMEQLERAAHLDRLNDLVLTPLAALADLPAVHVDAATSQGIRHGVQYPRALLAGDVPDGAPFRVIGTAGRLLAVYRVEGKKVRAEVVLA